MEYANGKNKVQILIPQNKGAENAGLYARFIATKLNGQGRVNTTIIAPIWERLIKNHTTADPLFAVLLAGDIVLCTQARKQQKLLSEMRVAFASGLPVENDFIKWAKFANDTANSEYILCAGETASLPYGYHGLIRAASMYENTSSIFSLKAGLFFLEHSQST